MAADVSDETTSDQDVKPGLPLELSIKPSALEYKVGEKIKFELILTNVGNGGLKVATLNEKTLFCDIDGQTWGTKKASGEAVVILLPGESVRKRLVVSGARAPGEFAVSCSYGMGVKGVRPSAREVLNIVR